MTKKCHNKPQFTKRGVRISPLFHWIRLFVFSILIAFLTWYGQQHYTNPFQFHTKTEIIGNSILFYSANYKIARDSLTVHISNSHFANGVSLSDHGIIKDSTILSNYSNGSISISFDDSTYIINTPTNSILFPTKKINYNILLKYDILIINGELFKHLNVLRDNIQPKLSLIFNCNNCLNSLPSNCKFINKSDKYCINKGQYGILTLKKLN